MKQRKLVITIDHPGKRLAVWLVLLGDEGVVSIIFVKEWQETCYFMVQLVLHSACQL